MANWCLNHLYLEEGSDEDKKSFSDYMENLIQLQKIDGFGVLLPDIDENDRHLFELCENCETYTFSTKWAPPPVEAIEALGKKFNISLSLEYDECGSYIYGKCFYFHETGETVEIDLDEEDFESFEYDEDRDIYVFEGEDWESDAEIKDTILARKISLDLILLPKL